jgi:hypothetical protein
MLNERAFVAAIGRNLQSLSNLHAVITEDQHAGIISVKFVRAYRDIDVVNAQLLSSPLHHVERLDSFVDDRIYLFRRHGLSIITAHSLSINQIIDLVKWCERVNPSYHVELLFGSETVRVTGNA